MEIWIRHENPAGGYFYVGPDGKINIQDFTNDVRYPAFEKKMNADEITIEDYKGSAEESAAILLTKKHDELSWSDGERDRIRDIIENTEDSGGDASALRAYRTALKDWPNSPYFPDTRPVES